jgi:Tol biopolymer transport system component
VRWPAALAVLALGGCGGGDEPPRAAATASPAGAERPAPRPGPRWPGPVAFAAERGGSLDVFVRDGERTRRLTAGRRDEFSPNWSGDRIAYRVNPPRDDAGDIWVMRSDGSGKRNLTRSPDVPDWSPAFSPDGRTIAYMSAHELWLMDADGSNQRQLTRAGELSEYPTWSPDGGALAFSGNRGGDFEILVIDVAGGEERNLTNSPGEDKWPAWSPDGERIAYISGDDVYVMAADGSDRRNVSRTPDLYENHPAWTADGRLTFLQHGESGPVHVRVVDRPAYDLPIDAVFVYDWR